MMHFQWHISHPAVHKFLKGVEIGGNFSQSRLASFHQEKGITLIYF